MRSILFVLPLLLLASCGEPTPQQKATQVNDLTKQMTTPAVAQAGGAGMMVLMDISGSMGGDVKSAQGGYEQKLLIAKRQVLSIVNKVAAYNQKNGLSVKIGVATFSGADSYSLVIPIGLPNPKSAEQTVNAIALDGGTNIGDAIIAAKKELDRSGIGNSHIITITDGENGGGADPADVAAALGKLDIKTSLYVIGFDVNASVFDGVKKAGSLVMAADNEADLEKTLSFVLKSKILVEKEENF